MRIWTVHPRYLDAVGLVAAWRESLLAQAVLRGQTHGYRNHPQLRRFRDTQNPLGAIAAYLVGLADEGDRRGYHFDRRKITARPAGTPIRVARWQLAAEWSLLGEKLKHRSPAAFARWRRARPRAHPLFRIVADPGHNQKREASREEPPPMYR